MHWSEYPIRLVQRAGLDWFTAKTAFERSIAFGHDALHVLAGVIVQLLAAALLRGSVGRWRPWLIVLVLELLNEASDLYGEIWPRAERLDQWGESAKDLMLTMALPTLLLLVSRFAPRLLAGRK